MSRVLGYLVVLSFFIFCVVYSYTFVQLGETEKRIDRMYEFAGDDYSKASYLLEVGDYFPFQRRAYPRGAFVSSAIIGKDTLSKAGYGESCAALEYIDLFDDLAVNRFHGTSDCCDSSLSGVSSIVVDQRNDRYLVMCGTGYFSYVVGVSKPLLEALVETFYSVEGSNGKI